MIAKRRRTAATNISSQINSFRRRLRVGVVTSSRGFIRAQYGARRPRRLTQSRTPEQLYYPRGQAKIWRKCGGGIDLATVNLSTCQLCPINQQQSTENNAVNSKRRKSMVAHPLQEPLHDT